jgi:hypothetical protein
VRSTTSPGQVGDRQWRSGWSGQAIDFTVTLLVLVKAEQYFWLLFVVGTVVLALIGGFVWLGRRGGKTAP